MKSARPFRRRAVHAALWCLSTMAAARGASIAGRISFPGSDNPAVAVYVYAPASAHLYRARVDVAQRSFHVRVPVGNYIVFATPSDPGAPNVFGAYTHCDGAVAAAHCRDHSFQDVAVGRAAARLQVEIADWSLSDTDADALARILGVAATPGPEPEGAPRFSEYAIDPKAAGPVAAPQLRRLHLDAADRAAMRDAVATGPNFAGTVTALVDRCGGACARLVLLDWRRGGLIEPPSLAQIDEGLPCRTSEAVLFRRDSRLLSVTRMRDGFIVTQYYLWEPGAATLELLAEYPRKESEFCAIDPP